jgi:hypothetical protein
VARAAPTNAEAMPTRAGWLGDESRSGGDRTDAGSGAKSGIAAEQLVAAEAGKSHFQSRLARRPGHEISVDAIHAGKVKRAQGFLQALESFFAREQELAMVGAQAVGGRLGNLRFAEIDFRKDYRERLNVAVIAAGERGDGGRVDAAAQENAQRNIGDQVFTDGTFQERAQMLRRSNGAGLRAVVGIFNVPVALRLRS